MNKKMTLEDLVRLASDAIAQKRHGDKTDKAMPKKKRTLVRHSTAEFTPDEKHTIMSMFRAGRSKKDIAKHVHRGNWRVAKFIDSQITIPPQPTKKAAKTAPVAEDTTVESAGLGSIKRSMERLHDKTTALENKISSLGTRLNDVTAMVARVQQTVDKIVREFVNTNPPPAEIAFQASRVNGSHSGQ